MAAETMAPKALRGAASAAVSAGNVLIELLAKARPPLIMGVLNVTPDSFSNGRAGARATPCRRGRRHHRRGRGIDTALWWRGPGLA